MSNSEHLEQVSLVNWFRKTYDQSKYRIFAVPNGELRNPIVAQRLKSEGVTSGVSDLIVLDKGKNQIIFIEMKRKRNTLKNGKQSKANLASPEQIEFLEFVNNMDCCIGFVAYGYQEAKERLILSMSE